MVSTPKAVLTRLSNITNETFQRDVASSTTRVSHAPLSPLRAPPHDTTLADFALLQKLDQVGRSLKRVQSLIEERQQKTSQTKD
uniref:Keto acyl-acyl carrier protein synthase II n=1 Tax=Tanacetum cinerariifolium TaxID=118510 RepID=A0A6L2LTD2_TANCI|nr:keto acyl-acyl carrier protein synthase II [Tanacetum cinerariifolium]